MKVDLKFQIVKIYPFKKKELTKIMLELVENRIKDKEIMF